MPPFSSRKTFGQNGQDILITFLEKHFGYKFEAGERNGKILNVEFIEELENCEYVPPIEKICGPKLRFSDKNGNTVSLTMPDMFMSRNSSSGFYWIEAKTHNQNDSRLIIDKDNFDDYATLYQNFTRQSFLVMCLNPSADGLHDVYWCEFESLLNTKPQLTELSGNLVYIWSMFSVMTKLNRYPIDINKYIE